jgi:aldehyde dehydrogenase (NAD+)
MTTNHDAMTVMRSCANFYINGSWVAPAMANAVVAINPSTEQPLGTVAMGSETDVAS